MTATHWHIHDAAGNHTGDICGGTGRFYVVYAHKPGRKSYSRVGEKKFRSAKAAMKFAGETLIGSNIYNRVGVALVSDYYDPTIIYEVSRR